MNLFDFKKFYNVGNHLMEYSSDEEYQRSSVGRFYYSCFGSMKNYYETSFRKTLPQVKGHSILINSLEESPFIEEQKLGRTLKKLRNKRNLADYNEKPLNRLNVRDSQKDAEDIFKILDNLNKNPIRLQFPNQN